MIKYYVELKDPDSGEIIDLYGYDNIVTFWTTGYVKDYPVNNANEAASTIDKLAQSLIDQGCIIINKEDRRLYEVLSNGS